MKILAAGGGSGGHVTPILAVLNELKKHDPDLHVQFVSDRTFGAQAKAILSHATVPVETQLIYSGKLRRYNGIPLWRQLLNIPTTLRNIRDSALIGVGFAQSIWHILRFKPDVVFTKGGFVCLPLGLAAAFLKIPLVIHDSDALPGWTNRVLARYATKITTGAPLDNYDYPAEKSQYVGIPVDEDFQPVTVEEQRKLKADLGFPDITRPLVVVTGGGLGAQRINNAVLSIASSLLEHAAVLHIPGKANYRQVNEQAPGSADYIVKPFIDTGMAAVLGAADIVITRAGATTMLELAALAKPVIIIPNPYLAGGHQLKNAAVYAETGAALVVDEEDLDSNPAKLLAVITDLLKNRGEQQRLAKALHKFAKPEAAIDVADLIVQAIQPEKVVGK